MKFFRLSYDVRQLSRKNIELINNTIIKNLELEGFSVPEETRITLDFEAPKSLSYHQHIFFSLSDDLFSSKKEAYFRKIAREYFELISLSVGGSGMGSYDLYPDETSYQQEAKMIIDNYLVKTANYEDEEYIREILDNNQLLKRWLEHENN